MPTFYKNFETPKSSPKDITKDSTSYRLNQLQEELKKNPKDPENIRIREEIRSLKRELNRAKQFTSIKESEILKGKESLDAISAADLMKLDKESKMRRGELLSKSFLYKRTNDIDGNIYEEPSNGSDLQAGDKLFVDFGKNKSANERIGLGHMLPINIEYVKVNNQIGVRTIISNRVGYYIEANARGYIPVYTGSTVEIPTKSEIFLFEEKIKNTGLIKNVNEDENNIANDSYINKLENTSIDAIEINSNTKESYNFWTKVAGLTHEQACGLLANEYAESGFNLNARGDGGKAHGIFQWHPDRRAEIQKALNIDISHATHEDQLKAALWEMKEGPERQVFGLVKTSNSSRESAEIFTKHFERPSDIIGETAKRGQMAEAFSILLDEDGRSTNLGDHVVKRGPANLGINSCAASVRLLLKTYGITGLPEENANGKNWEEILNHRPNQFIKMKISHPDYAYPGAILVYNGSGTKGSDMNKKYGHVEIKGSDGKYYSYYESEMSAGSAKTNTKDSRIFTEETGFIGYAYYPKQMKS